MIQTSIFGESHGPNIGILIENLPPGLEIDHNFIAKEMQRRSPGGPLATERQEDDKVTILSGVYQNKTTGTPLCAIIANKGQHSSDYEAFKGVARPGHADYTGFIRYQGFNDPRGGGHFSGRLTAPLVFAGALIKQILAQKHIIIGAHIKQIGAIEDQPLDYAKIPPGMINLLEKNDFPAISRIAAQQMKEAIIQAKAEDDSLGGVVECMILGVPAGIGQPGQNSVESILSRHIFAIPAVKGISFGEGFHFAEMKGSEANDRMIMKSGKPTHLTNYNGGVLGGITNHMPIVFQTAIKPTPSIAILQQTIDYIQNIDTLVEIHGRHDPCIVIRAVPVIEAVSAIALAEILNI